MGSPKKTPPRPALNAFDLEVENFIASFLLREGLSPSQNQIAKALGKHLYSVQFSLKKLLQNGRVESTLKNGKGLVVTAAESNPSTLVSLPLLGIVAAGRPIEAIEQRRTIEVPAWMMKPRATYFVLQVQGDSMIEDHIEDGDFILVRQTHSAQNGERVVAIIDQEATLKRFEKKKDRIWLHPANVNLSSMEIASHHDFRIAGIFSGVLRKASG